MSALRMRASRIRLPSGFFRSSDIAERKTIELALKKGLHPRVAFADIKQAASYLETSVKHFRVGRDVRILPEWRRLNGEGVRGMVTGPPSAAAPQQTVSTY
jgi:hypothetical protein